MIRAHLYVSIAPDLGSEREVIGRALAVLPVDVGWQATYTPGPLDPAGDPLSAGQAHVYILVMGEDIRAPMGVEWLAARRAARPTLALLKESARTPAAQEFVRVVDVDWQRYQAANDIGPRVQMMLAQTILDHAREFDLRVVETQTLADLVKDLRRRHADGAPASRLGAGHGGVIFAPSREAGQGGIEIGKRR